MKQSKLKAPSFLSFIIFITLNFNNVNGFITSRPLLMLPTRTRARIGTTRTRTRISISRSSSSSENFSVVIGKGSTLNLEGNGTLTFSDSLLVEGTLKGKLKCLHDINKYRTNDDDNDDDDNITLVKIGLQGELHADVNCVSNLVVDGVLRGDVMCKTVVIGSTAHVIGDIVAEEITIHPGGSLIGIIRTGNFAQFTQQEETETTTIAPDIEIQAESIPSTLTPMPTAIPIATPMAIPMSTPTPSIIPMDKNDYNHNNNNNNNIQRTTAQTSQREINQKSAISANEYHNTIQNDAIRKQKEAWGIPTSNGQTLPSRQSTDIDVNADVSKNDLVDDFGNQIVTLDPDKGKYVDSFGHPLIRGADDDQVASFREIRNLSKSTWNMIASHKKEKEREEIRRRAVNQKSVSTSSGYEVEEVRKKEKYVPPIMYEDGDEDDGDEDDGDMPSFLQHF